MVQDMQKYREMRDFIMYKIIKQIYYRRTTNIWHKKNEKLHALPRIKYPLIVPIVTSISTITIVVYINYISCKSNVSHR